MSRRSDTPSPKPLTFAQGDQLGDYVVTGVISHGAMSVVCAARHVYLTKQRVALKVLRPELAAEHPEELSRFVREAQVVSQLRHPGIPRIMAFFELTDRDPPLYVMGMELLRGRDLHEHVNVMGPLDARHAVEIAVQVTDALGALHGAQVLHRDIKPVNIYLTWKRDKTLVVKLLDFGVSKGMAERHATNLTAPGIVPGTPEYMAPEQLVGDPLDERTDIYGLGASLYHILTAQLPFGRVPDHRSFAAFWARVVHEPLQPVGERRARIGWPPVPAALEAVVMRCMEKSPKARFANVAEVRAALLACGA